MAANKENKENKQQEAPKTVTWEDKFERMEKRLRERMEQEGLNDEEIQENLDFLLG